MSIIASLIGFNILIVVHELGHYLAARLVGLRAERVSIGVGQPWLLGVGNIQSTVSPYFPWADTFDSPQ